MKNRKTAFGIIAAVLLIMLLLTAGSEEGAAPPTEGRLTITGLEEYEGCYVIAEGSTEDDLGLFFAKDINSQNVKFSGGRIINGSVTLNVWIFTDSGELEPYNGNDENVFISLLIFRKKMITESTNEDDFSGMGEIYPVEFQNGIASTECGDMEDDFWKDFL